ncbi:hypothetical protein B9Z55_008200 [Caenorhabditis nigoni]|uniref:Secreted protein n=1 Tax=Caenorhabditis nigoni TaxID=1611254 RepID=A0A2G5VD31_9PELO|nr:hypothetical protein B9Z55_008200 [Caenorhabditis nigoni]
MLHLLFLASSLFVLQVSTQLSAYETWTTDYIRYCEMIQSTNAATPLYRGVACGRDAWNVMSTSKACTLLVNPPWGFPNCTQDYDGAFVYRSGSGYCMKSKVCGATVEIDFLKSADNSSIIYTWTTTDSEALIAQGYTKVGNCYGYSLLPNPAASNANLMNELSFP